MIQDHPDLDGSSLRWCKHKNVCEIQTVGQVHTYYVCEDCGDTFPVIGDTDQWLPKLIGTRLDGT